MKRPAICLFVWVALVGWAATASAKEGGDTTGDAGNNTVAAADDSATAGAGNAGTAATGDTGTAASDNAAGGGDQAGGPADATGAKAGATPSESLDADETEPGKVDEDLGVGTTAGTKAARPNANGSWSDIVVVPRKSFLKGGRLELQPFTGLTINDNLIRHYVFGVDLNYFLTDVFWIGLQGQYFVHQLTTQEELLGSEFNRAPTLNKLLYGGALNFGYVPVYGKFALLDRSIVSWEIWASAGVGVTFTEVIPRDPAHDPLAFKNTVLTPNVGIGSRFFLTDWLTLNFALRDYFLPDKFEPLDESGITTSAQAKAQAHSELVNNVMFTVGVGFYLPTKFTYKTPR